jgi:glucokinase
MRAKSSAKKVLAYDLGGTKVSVGVVTSKGKVLEEVRVPSVFDKGKAAVFEQLTDLGKQFLGGHPEIRRVGVASAGPLDSAKGLLLDPTNFASAEGSWGITPFTRILGRKLKKPVYLENDAAASMLAEHWVGAARGCKNAMILTLGTGLGTGIFVNGELLRAGRNLHPEAGHMIVRHGDSSAPCGCGNLGCAEAFLSGRGFSRRARARFGNPDLMAKDVADLARKRDPRALAAFEEYAEILAVALHNYAMMFAPEVVVFTGSFAEAADLFLDSTKRQLEHLLVRRRTGVDMLPRLVISKLQNQAGLVGGAYVALHAQHA